jgi:uncharacterized protein (DUF1501 family)
MTMNASRRVFLRSAGLGFFALGLPPAFLVRAAQAQSAKSKSLVVVFQRGAMDGLNVVIPFRIQPIITPPEHRRATEPRRAESAIDLDRLYGLHPALAAPKISTTKPIGVHSRRRIAGQHALPFRRPRLYGDRHTGIREHAGWLA